MISREVIRKTMGMGAIVAAIGGTAMFGMAIEAKHGKDIALETNQTELAKYYEHRADDLSYSALMIASAATVGLVVALPGRED